MAGKKLETDLRNKLVRLAGDDLHWLVDATAAFDRQPGSVKNLILDATEDDRARKLVDVVIKKAGVAGRE